MLIVIKKAVWLIAFCQCTAPKKETYTMNNASWIVFLKKKKFAKIYTSTLLLRCTPAAICKSYLQLYVLFNNNLISHILNKYINIFNDSLDEPFSDPNLWFPGNCCRNLFLNSVLRTKTRIGTYITFMFVVLVVKFITRQVVLWIEKPFFTVITFFFLGYD